MKTFDELQKIKDKLDAQLALRTDHHENMIAVVHIGESGEKAGAREILCFISDLIIKNKLEGVSAISSGETQYTGFEPVVEVITPEKVKTVYGNVNTEIAEKIFKQHLIEGNVVKEFTIQSK